MRIAVISDIHGNLTAFQAVLADLRQTSPDLILHGGDLADTGASRTEIVDQIRDLGWPGVFGNTDEMLFRPESLTDFAQTSPQMQPLLPTIEEMASATREALGEERQSRKRLELTVADGERGRSGISLPTAWPADCRLWTHSLPIRQKCCRTDRDQYRQRQSLLRRRPPRFLSAPG
jgi:3',5'-cyclic AMP phosphodiesterase CpdA